MSRRPPGPGMNPRPASRMAPGGRMWSESPIRRPYPRVRQAGEASTVGTVVLRPVLLEGYIPPGAFSPGSSATLNLVGGAGNSTMRDQSDATYARMTAELNLYIGSVKATFETASLDWEPRFATFTWRVRALVNDHPSAPPGTGYWEFTSATGTAYANADQFPPASRWVPGSEWVDMASDQWQTHGVGGPPLLAQRVPSAADVAAGVVVRSRAAAWEFDVSFLQLDVADMWLTLSEA